MGVNYSNKEELFALYFLLFIAMVNWTFALLMFLKIESKQNHTCICTSKSTNIFLECII